MHATGKIFGKICLETLSDTFQYVACDQGMEGGIQFFGMEGGGGVVISNRSGKFELFGLQWAEAPTPSPSLSGTS